LSKTPYRKPNEQQLNDSLKSKQRYIAGEFKRSIKNSSDSLTDSGDKYINAKNDYKVFLNDIQELPRLSVLENYR